MPFRALLLIAVRVYQPGRRRRKHQALQGKSAWAPGATTDLPLNVERKWG
jgi:hypothetical protein